MERITKKGEASKTDASPQSIEKGRILYFTYRKNEIRLHLLRECNFEWVPLSQAPKPFELLNDEGISRSAERDQRRCLWTPQAFEKA